MPACAGACVLRPVLAAFAGFALGACGSAASTVGVGGRAPLLQERCHIWGALPWLCGAGGEKAGKRPPGLSPNPPGPPGAVRWGAGLAAAPAAPSLSRQWGLLQGRQLPGNLSPGAVSPASVCTAPPPGTRAPPCQEGAGRGGFRL